MLLVLASARLAAAEPSAPRVFLFDGPQLAATRQRVLDGDAALKPALADLVRRADECLEAGPFSVVNKSATPPSSDKRDYMSLAPYWWPDPTKPDGRPYIRRDGETNPEIDSVPNHADLDRMSDAVQTLSLAYYFTGDQKYANRAALLLRAWFLAPKTGMRPNLEYAQAIPGVNEGRGIGIIESRRLARVVDSLGLLAGCDAWSAADNSALLAWFDKFLEWMLTSEHGRDEADELNNHGTFYDVQVATYALLLDKREIARQWLAAVPKRRIAMQIDAQGRQPLELARTKAWSYSVANLSGLMSLARLAEHVDVDVWNFATDDGRSLRKAVDFLAPYGTGVTEWPHPQITGFSAEIFYPVLRQAAAKYPDGPYAAMVKGLPSPFAEAPLVQSPFDPVNQLRRSYK
jgi:hypothetical protein